MTYNHSHNSSLKQPCSRLKFKLQEISALLKNQTSFTVVADLDVNQNHVTAANQASMRCFLSRLTYAVVKVLAEFIASLSESLNSASRQLITQNAWRLNSIHINAISRLAVSSAHRSPPQRLLPSLLGNPRWMEVSGLEPLTSCLQSRRSTN